MRERESARNISPQLEQTDSHLHGVECKVENLLLYISLFGVPIALPFPVPRHTPLSHPPAPSHQLSSLYLIQLAGPADRDESFLFAFPPSYSSPFLSPSLVPCLRLAHFYPHLLYIRGVSFTSFWSFIFFLIYLQRSLCAGYPETASYVFPIASIQNQIIKIGNCFQIKISINAVQESNF